MYRRFFRVGAVVLVAGLVLGLALWVAGSEIRIDPKPPLQTATLREIRAESLCPTLGPGPACPLPPTRATSTAAVYVPSGNVFVDSFTSSQNETGIAVLSGTGLDRLAETSVPYLALQPTFAGPGPYVFLLGQRYDNRTGWTDSLVAFNWTVGSVAATVPMPFAWPENFSFAYDAPRAELFVALSPGLGALDRLLTLRLPSFSVVQNVTIPSESGLPLIWTVDSGARVELALNGVSALREFDPSTSTWSAGPDLGYPVWWGTLDAATGRAYLLVGPFSCPCTVPLQILGIDPGTGGVVSSTAVGQSKPNLFLPDGSHGDLYVLNPVGVDGYNLSDGRIIGSWAYWANETFSPETSLSYDPLQDVMIMSGMFQESPSAPYEPGLSVMNLTHGSSPQPSYTGLPWVGSQFPLLVLVIGLVSGIALLVWGAVLRSRAAEKEISFDGGPLYP